MTGLSSLEIILGRGGGGGIRKGLCGTEGVNEKLYDHSALDRHPDLDLIVRTDQSRVIINQ